MTGLETRIGQHSGQLRSAGELHSFLNTGRSDPCLYSTGWAF